jgi:phosphatidylserine decarboxylase
MMTPRALATRLVRHEGLNFALTNRIPRRAATRIVGRIAQAEHPLFVRPAMALWRTFADLDLRDAATSDFPSLRACFTRALRPGARPVDPDPAIATSPCDGIVGACGRIAGAELLQVKGRPYPLRDLLRDYALVSTYRDGLYVTLRLTSGMYHRFHAPHDLVVEQVDHIPGDAWNVNPPALRRIRRLYCRNERALLRTRLAATGHLITLVPVAAILVAGIRLHCAGGLLGARHAGTPRLRPMAPYAKGDELGWFEHGSTIIVLAPAGFRLCPGIVDGRVTRMGEPLLRLP